MNTSFTPLVSLVDMEDGEGQNGMQSIPFLTATRLFYIVISMHVNPVRLPF